MKNRIALIFLFVTLCWGLLFVHGMYIQVWPHPRLKELRNRLFETTLEIPARRGVILDRDGKELAVSISGYSLFADPAILEGRNAVAARLAKQLRMSKSDLKAKFKQTDRRFVWIQRGLNEDKKNLIQSWKVRGLGFIEEPRRVYPQDHLAAQVLGFVGADGHGLEGTELFLDKRLSGKSRKVLLPRDARGRPLLADGHVLTDIPDGSEATLTLDSELQYVLESELEAAVRIHNAQSAVGVVLDAQTSEILAMAQVPLINLNRILQEPVQWRRNRPVTDAFEPGSTLKPFVIAAALHEGTLKPNRRIDCEGGKFKVGIHWITEAEKTHHFGMLTVNEILSYSSNVGMAKIALELGAPQLRSWLERFGFGRSTGVDFPGEAKGILSPLPWRPHFLSSVGFGQAVATTPLQIAQAYAVIANGGILRKPFLVKTLRNPEREDGVEFTPEAGQRVLTPQETSILTFMLTSATTGQGTGINARIPGFPVAGKTGTAQKIDDKSGGYKKDAYISSFAGFVPAHDPRFVIYIAVDEPKNGYYGSQVAAPVFSKVAQFAVRKKGLAPILIEDRHVLASEEDVAAPEEASVKDAPEMARGLVPQFLGLSLREVFQKAHGLPMSFQIKGSGIVARTIPEAGQSLPPNSRVQLILQRAE